MVGVLSYGLTHQELQEYNVNVRAFHYNSSNGNYVEFELKEGASYAF